MLRKALWMEAICDLHIHANCSDGTLTPAQLILLARQRNIGAVALCDHNTVAGLPVFLEAARDSGRMCREKETEKGGRRNET